LPGFDFMVNVSDLIDENRILYYPNPVGESLFIKHLDGVAIEQAVVFDLQGRALRQYYPQAGDQLEANLNGLAPGVYVVMVTDARKQVATRKIVKQ
jgi:hypothetical protein